VTMLGPVEIFAGSAGGPYAEAVRRIHSWESVSSLFPHHTPEGKRP